MLRANESRGRLSGGQRANEVEEGLDSCWVAKEEGERVCFAFEFVMEDMSFVLVVGALENVVTDCLGGDTLAMWADWSLRVANAEEMLDERRVASVELCEEGRLVMIEVVN